MKSICRFIFFIPLVSCYLPSLAQQEKQQDTVIIAFGSCSRQENPDQRWDDILQNKPDLWIWLGDNIYGDSHNMDVLRSKYNYQKKNPGYQRLLHSNTRIAGTWDDHDYGINDGGKNYPMKDASKSLMISFLDIDKDNPVNNHKGVYQSYNFNFNHFSFRLILLDTRYFRDTIYRNSENKAYMPNKKGTILGEEQWVWLENEIKESRSEFIIIGSSIQVIPMEHPSEKWANFPKERKRLLTLIQKYPDKKFLIISGDRHVAEISRIKLNGLDYPLYDFTSSGLTHTIQAGLKEPNRYRIGNRIISKNFGLIKIISNGSVPAIYFEVRGPGNVRLNRTEAKIYK
jgi:alkaline phosphatase D